MDSSAGHFSSALAAIIKKRREGNKLSRAALARLAGLHQTYIGLLERGARSPNIDTVKAIADALGVTVTQLVKDAEKEFET